MRTIVVALTLAFIAPPVSAEPQAGRDHCFQMGDAVAAIRACTAIIQSDQASRASPDGVAAAYDARANADRRAGQLDQAIADYTQAIALYSDKESTYLAYVNRGGAYEREGRHTDAIADYNSAITIGPDQPPAYLGRALSYEALGQREEAIADYRTALKILPSLKAAQDGLRRLAASP
jgi:tetratricopeptide (TPR) repeat protein